MTDKGMTVFTKAIIYIDPITRERTVKCCWYDRDGNCITEHIKEFSIFAGINTGEAE